MIHVLLNRLLVKPLELKKEHEVPGTDIKIALETGDAKEDRRMKAAQVEGTVIAVGDWAYKDYGYDIPPVKIGDRVLYAKFAGKGIYDPETNEELVVINDEDVICIVKEKTNE